MYSTIAVRSRRVNVCLRARMICVRFEHVVRLVSYCEEEAGADFFAIPEDLESEQMAAMQVRSARGHHSLHLKLKHSKPFKILFAF